MDQKTLASYIDHTALKADTPASTIKKLCAEAREFGFASVCVNPCYARLVSEELKGSTSLTCVVIGFPLGANTPELKAFETEDAIQNGAQEVDMVVNVGAVKSGDWSLVQRDIEAVVNTAGTRAAVKVILETCLLTDEEKIRLCAISKAAGAAFVKTSTGFSTGGATVSDISLMRKSVGADMGVKASGGVRTYEDAMAMIEAGATRIGASAGVEIIQSAQA